MQHIVINNLYNPTFVFTECDGSAMDLSICTVKFILKRNREDEDSSALLSKEYVNPTTNMLQFEFTAEDTVRLSKGNAVGAVKIYRTDGRNEEVWSDEYVIKEGVFND